MTLRGSARPASPAGPPAPTGAGRSTGVPATPPPGAAPRATPAARAVRALVAVLPQWVVARLVVGGALALAHLLVDRTHPSVHGIVARVHQGLLGWDAGWYQAIALHGYGPYGHQALRFFPLYPLAARALAVLPGISVGTALLLLANGSALVATALLRVLVHRETGDRRLADRSAWLLSLAPPAFVLVMGYAEGPLLACAVGCFLAVRRPAVLPAPPGRPLQVSSMAGSSGGGNPAMPADGVSAVRRLGGAAPCWWAAALLGVAAGLIRPLGVLLVVPLAVEAVRRWGRAGGRERVASLAAVVAPAVGGGIFLCWAWATYGDPWLPLTVQAQSGHHGGLADPFRTLLDDARGALHHHFGTALHVPWVLLVVVLLVVAWRKLPAAYGAYATAVVVVALSGTNLDSFERYALSAFPLVVAGATLASGPRTERAVLALAAAGLAGYALLAFCNLSVP